MPTATIEAPASDQVIDMTPTPTIDRQEFRIVSISSKSGDIFKLKFQVADGIEWMPERSHELASYLVQSPKHYEQLSSVVSRVFDAEWGNKDVRITNLKFYYADEDDKGDMKRGIEPRKPGELTKLTIASEYQSQMVISKKAVPWLSLGAFDQYVCKDVDDYGYLQKEEVKALQDLINEFSVCLARKLNERVEFKAKQLKLL